MYTLTKRSIFSGDGVSLNSTISIQSDACDKRSIDIEENTTDLLVNICFKKEDIKGVVLLADKDVTIKTNSDSAPDDTINLVAGQSQSMIDEQGELTFSEDVSKIYVSSAETSKLEIWVYADSTPSTP